MDIPGLAFEKPILELEQELEAACSSDSRDEETIRSLRERLADTVQDVYSSI